MTVVTITPRPRQWVPLTAAEQAESTAAALQLRDALDAQRAAARPLQLAMHAALSDAVPLADVAAAVDCPCACHPRIDLSLHAGGSDCACQLTTQDREARQAAALTALAGLGIDDAELEEDRDAVATRAGELGVRARIAVSGPHVVLTGLADGRGFYLRERHGVYTVTVSSDDDPAGDPWAAPATTLTLDIAQGVSDHLDVADRLSPARALDVAVGAVRTFLRQRSCDHGGARGGDRYCPACGVARVAPELP